MRTTNRLFLIAALALLGAFVLATPTEVEAFDYDLGARVGVNYNVLTHPNDPVGEPTLLYGSMFTGTGLTLGLAAKTPVYDFGGPVLAVELDLFYGQHKGQGFAAFEEQRRTVTISTHTVRVPLLLHLAGPPNQTRMRIGAGVDLIAGITSASVVVEENIPGNVTPLETTPTTHVTLTTVLGLDLNAGSFSLPFEFRLNWNPFVGPSTPERFEGFQDSDNIGQYQVAFDWQFMFMTGISWSNPF